MIDERIEDYIHYAELDQYYLVFNNLEEVESYIWDNYHLEFEEDMNPYLSVDNMDLQAVLIAKDEDTFKDLTAGFLHLMIAGIFLDNGVLRAGLNLNGYFLAIAKPLSDELERKMLAEQLTEAIESN